MTDPDSVLDPLTYEVKETGPDGQEVKYIHFLSHFVNFQLLADNPHAADYESGPCCHSRDQGCFGQECQTKNDPSASENSC